MTLADRMKLYERTYCGENLNFDLPVCVRIDGKAFHSWTRGLTRPYDKRLQTLFDETTKFLVDKTNALIGYTQSDEISLILYKGDNEKSQIMFDGKSFKLISVLASMATAKFNSLVPEILPEKANHLAFFDCRVWNVLSEYEVLNYLIWRELDATRNSISMAAQSKFSHSELQGRNSEEMKHMLKEKHIIDWADYPSRFKYGAYFKKIALERGFTEEEISKLPVNHEAHTNPNLKFVRNFLSSVVLSPIVTNQEALKIIFKL